MDYNEWEQNLTDEQRAEIAKLDDSEVMDYLSSQDIALPDDMLENVVGGINPFSLLGQMLKRRLLGDR